MKIKINHPMQGNILPPFVQTKKNFQTRFILPVWNPPGTNLQVAFVMFDDICFEGSVS